MCMCFTMGEEKCDGESKMKPPKYLLCSMKDSYHFPIHCWQEIKSYCSTILKLGRLIPEAHKGSYKAVKYGADSLSP